MSRAQSAASTGAVKNDLLARLGLPAGADSDAVENTHEAIVDFLDGAPAEISGWAQRRRQEADRLYSLITGPESAREVLAAPVAPAGAAAAAAPSSFQQPPAGRTPLPTPLKALIGLALVLAVGFGVYQFGKPSSNLPGMTSAQGTTPAATPGLDQAKIADLMAKIQADPKDTASLQALGDLYYAAGNFTTCRTFLDKILAYDPTNEKALIGAGAAAFNAGDTKAAETYWQNAAKAYPNNPEVHYDLGFLYMTTKQTDKMKAEWDLVVKLAPDSNYAKTVQSHVGSVTASPAIGTATPAPTASTPAPSPSGK